MEAVCLKNGSNIKSQAIPLKNNVVFTSMPNTLSNTIEQDEIQVNTQYKKKNTNRIIIAIGTIGICVVTLIGLIRCKANKAKLINSIPDDLKSIFSKIKDKNGDEFIDEAYSQMVKYLGLEGFAPGKIGKTGVDGVMSITGGFNPAKNTIGYSDGFFTKLDKRKQLNLLSHELRHCKQSIDFLRTEGIGVDEYAKVWTEVCIKSKLNDPFFKVMAYKPAVEAGKGEELLEQLRIKIYKATKEDLEQNYSEVFKLPKIKADSEEGKTIHKMFEGCKNYEGLGMFGTRSSNYKKNPLEVDAYGFGDKIEKLFCDFIRATKS